VSQSVLKTLSTKENCVNKLVAFFVCFTTALFAQDNMDSATSELIQPAESTSITKPVSFHFSIDAQGGYIKALKNDSINGSIAYTGIYRHSLVIPHGIYFPTDLRVNGFTLPAIENREFTAIEKYTTPNSILGYSGIGWHGPVDVAVRGMARPNIGNTILALPWSPSLEESYLYGSFKERYHVGYDVAIAVPHERFNINLHSLTLVANQLYENSANDSLNSYKETDTDWFLTGKGTFNIWNRNVMASGQLLHKNDFAEDGAYDLLFGKLGVATDTKIKKRLRFWGGIYGRAYDNRRMAERGYLNDGGLFQNIGIASDLRTIYDFKRQLYVKADLFTDISNRMTKTKYDVNVRKVWRQQNISSQLGFWSTPGALFPRTCSYYSGSFGIGEQITVVPNARLYWQWDRGTEKYTYDHTDLNLELNYKLPAEEKKIFTRLSFHGGIDCKFFEINPIGEDVVNRLFYSDQIAGYIGIRTYL